MASSSRLWRPVDATPIGAWRVGFGLLMLVHVWRLHVLGMYSRTVLQPAFRFHYSVLGHEINLPLPTTETGACAHLLFTAVAACGMTAGVATRYCAMAFALSYSAYVLSETSIFNNHYYLYVILAWLIVLVGGDEAVSVTSRWWRPRQDSTSSTTAAPPTIALWKRDLLRLQLCIVYAYAAVAKMNSDWILHHEPMKTKLVDEAGALYHPELLPLLSMPSVAMAVSLGGVAFDACIGPLLLLRSTRPYALGLLTPAFHVTNHFLWSLGEFPWVMLACNLLFCDELPWLRTLPSPDALHGKRRPAPHGEVVRRTGDVSAAAALMAAADAAARPKPPTATTPATTAPCAHTLAWTERLAFGLGIAHALVQLLLPMRPWLVHRFDPLDVVHCKTHAKLSWRMMAVTTRNFFNVSLRSETLRASFVMTRTYNRLYVVRTANGSRSQRQQLQLTPHLQPRQAGYMPYSPHMLVAYAKWAAKAHGCDHDEEDHDHGCKVVGELWSSINGRPLQRFVSPTTDLSRAAIHEHARPEWVLPLLAHYGNATWRARMARLRRRVTMPAAGGGDSTFGGGESGRSGGSGGGKGTSYPAHVAFFADVAGGSFTEAFPAIHPFPARALVVPLDGVITVTITDATSSLHEAKSSRRRSDGAEEQTDDGVQRTELSPPTWGEDAEGGSGEAVELRPSSAPVRVPFGRAHVISTSTTSSLWAYVFDAK